MKGRRSREMHYETLIKDYKPLTPEDQVIKENLMAYVETLGLDVLHRRSSMAHITASTVILNPSLEKMLMIHHKIYDTWTWQGGHADGEVDLLHVALKEAEEETGLKRVSVIQRKGQPLYRLDIMPVKGHWKKGSYVAPHLHLNVAFVLTAKEEDALKLNKEETSGILWVPLVEVEERAKEPEITPIYFALIEEAKNERSASV